MKLVLGTSVYSLGFAGGLSAFFRSFSRGEVDEVTRLIYEARENALAHIHQAAQACQAEHVIGTKLFVHEIGQGMVEVLAIGTAIRRHPGVLTQTQQLLPQAIIRDRDTFFDPTITGSLSRDHTAPAASPQANAQANPVGCLIAAAIMSIVVSGLVLCGVLSAFFD